MFTWGPKYLLAVSLSGLVGAVIYGAVTGGDPVGVVSAGYKGGVGDHVGYSILLGVFVVAQVLAWVLVAVRDGDAEEMASRAGVDVVPAVTPPTEPSYWGLMSAFGAAFVVVGLALSTIFWILGLVLLFAAGLQWLVQAWADRATGDPEVNRVIRNRVVGPFEVPLMALIGFAVMAVAMSRVFLAASVNGAVIAGTVITIVIFGGAVAASKVEIKPAMIRALAIAGGVAVLALGIGGAVMGERDFHHGEEHHSDDGEDHGDEGEGE